MILNVITKWSAFKASQNWNSQSSTCTDDCFNHPLSFLFYHPNYSWPLTWSRVFRHSCRLLLLGKLWNYGMNKEKEGAGQLLEERGINQAQLSSVDHRSVSSFHLCATWRVPGLRLWDEVFNVELNHGSGLRKRWRGVRCANAPTLRSLAGKLKVIFIPVESNANNQSSVLLNSGPELNQVCKLHYEMWSKVCRHQIIIIAPICACETSHFTPSYFAIMTTTLLGRLSNRFWNEIVAVCVH